jgi:hypothetical protein
MNGAENVQAQRCASLLKAVLNQAALDLATPAHATEQREQRNRDPHARLSLRFFLTPQSPLEIYADALGLDAAALRQGLQARGGADSSAFGADERRVVRLRMRWWAAEQYARHGVPGFERDELDADADTRPGKLDEVRA